MPRQRTPRGQPTGDGRRSAPARPRIPRPGSAERSPAEAQRAEKVAAEIHQVLARLLREEIKDPRVGPLSLTSLHMSRDLRIAHINLVPLGGQGDPAALLEGLEAAGGFLRRAVGQELRLRHTPELRFHLDEGVDEAMRMTRLLRELEAQREDGGDGI